MPEGPSRPIGAVAGWFEKRNRTFFLTLNFAYVAAIAIFAGLYASGGSIGQDLQAAFPNASIADTLPLAVPAFGALGAITISIIAICYHCDDWNPCWSLWHATRAIVGAIMGTIAFFIFIAVIQSTNTPANLTPGAKGSIVYYLVAFVVGYREKTFRDLIQRVIDVVLAPGDGTDTDTSTATGAAPPASPPGRSTRASKKPRVR